MESNKKSNVVSLLPRLDDWRQVSVIVVNDNEAMKVFVNMRNMSVKLVAGDKTYDMSFISSLDMCMSITDASVEACQEMLVKP